MDSAKSYQAHFPNMADAPELDSQASSAYVVVVVTGSIYAGTFVHEAHPYPNAVCVFVAGQDPTVYLGVNLAGLTP
jgi:hypothetical protein